MVEYILMWKVNIKNKDNIDEDLKEIREILKAENIEFKEKFIEEWTGDYRTRHYEPSIGIYINKKDQKKAEELIKDLQNTENIIESHDELNAPAEDYELEKSINNIKTLKKVIIYAIFLFIIAMCILSIVVNNMQN